MDDAPQGVLFRVLGPLEAVVDGHAVALGGAHQRLVLAALVARANTVVSTDRLIEIMWGDEPPDSALSTLQKYVYRLRSAVGVERLVTRSPGYLLRVGEGESDSSRFESLLAVASRQGGVEGRACLVQLTGGAQAGGDGEERLEARGVGFPVADAQHVPG